MRVVSIVGARPQFVKLAPVAKAFAAKGIDHKIIHTGQHYDVNMSDSFFVELGIPNPDLHLGVGGGSHGVMTGRMLEQLDPVLEDMDPDWVLVYGDTNSTIAGTLSAVKMHLPVAHLEAGLRSFNRRMPEEHNRVLTDHAADLCLAPTEVAMGHLADEGLAARRECKIDKRGQFVEITEAGRELQKRMWAAYSAAIEKHVGSKLSDADAAKLCMLLDRLGCSCGQDPQLAAGESASAR